VQQVRKTLQQDLAGGAGWWLWFVLGLILANYSRMRWDDFGWVGFLALLAGANSFLIMSRYWYAEYPQPEIRPTLVAFFLGIFFGVGVNHGLIEAFASVAGVLVGLGGIYVAMFIIGVMAEMNEPQPQPDY